MRIYLPKLVPPCPLTRSHALSPQSLPKSVISSTTIKWRRHISHSYLNYQVPKVYSEELLLSRSIRCKLSRLRCHGHSLLLSSYFHRISRKEDSACSACGQPLYRTSIISSSTVLPLNLFVNLSLAPLSLFLTYGPDLGVWPDCWGSAEFLHAPIPRKGSGSITTTTITNIIRIRAYDIELRLKLRSINMNCKVFFKFQIRKLIITS